MSLLVPVYYNKELIKNILASTGDGYANFKKIVENNQTKNAKNIKLGGELGAEVGLNEIIQIIAKLKANGKLNADINTDELATTAIKTIREQENTEFAQFYQSLDFLKEKKLIKKFNKEKSLVSGDFIEFNCKVLRDSFRDTLEFIFHSLTVYLNSLDEYAERIFDYSRLETPPVNTSFEDYLKTEIVKERTDYWQKNKLLYVAHKALSELIPIISKSDVTELRVSIKEDKDIVTVVFLEDKYCIGSIDKLYGNEYKMIGKVISFYEKGKYSPLESTVFGQLSDSIIDQLDKALAGLDKVFKENDLTKNSNLNLESQISKSKGNLRLKNVRLLKVIPIAFYL